MGYTHYFEFKVPKGIKARDLEERYQTAIAECSKVARHWNTVVAVKGSVDDFARLSGFSAHTKPSEKYGGLQLNGKGEYAHEPFELREHFKQNMENGALHSCKTAHKPYDTVIVACLAILKYRLGDAIEVSSDGNATDWMHGVRLARQVIRRAVPNPILRYILSLTAKV
jgi:hypothetical protein